MTPQTGERTTTKWKEGRKRLHETNMKEEIGRKYGCIERKDKRWERKEGRTDVKKEGRKEGEGWLGRKDGRIDDRKTEERPRKAIPHKSW